ncbi:hypothetical protein PC129_g21173 [Phytophthora cactorum]|uniref:Uncharacterized protein n=1 Tax=Phytophthora cactorum TaxID=29920 RepID=A0A8T1H6I3_9STRA|nr:hypothetical protein PC129_g21173 [Phytophthora cactorum]
MAHSSDSVAVCRAVFEFWNSTNDYFICERRIAPGSCP